MKLSAKEAQDLMPRGYIPSEQICARIKVIAEAGLDYFYTDLTQGQIQEFQELGYKVDKGSYDRRYKISWS